jgi:hypothetical protein
LSSQIEALTQEKKEKENVMINIELINLKNAFMFNFEEIRRMITKAKIKKLVEKKRTSKEFAIVVSIVEECK